MEQSVMRLNRWMSSIPPHHRLELSFLFPPLPLIRYCTILHPSSSSTIPRYNSRIDAFTPSSFSSNILAHASSECVCTSNFLFSLYYHHRTSHSEIHITLFLIARCEPRTCLVREDRYQSGMLLLIRNSEAHSVCIQADILFFQLTAAPAEWVRMTFEESLSPHSTRF